MLEIQSSGSMLMIVFPLLFLCFFYSLKYLKYVNAIIWFMLVLLEKHHACAFPMLLSHIDFCPLLEHNCTVNVPPTNIWGWQVGVCFNKWYLWRKNKNHDQMTDLWLSKMPTIFIAWTIILYWAKKILRKKNVYKFTI